MLNTGRGNAAVPTISLSLTQVKMIADNDRFKPIFSNRRIGAAKEINTTANKKQQIIRENIQHISTEKQQKFKARI